MIKVCKNHAKTPCANRFLHSTGTVCKNPSYTPHRGVYIGGFLHYAVQPLTPWNKKSGVFAHPEGRRV
jgi:hypothetical protein